MGNTPCRRRCRPSPPKSKGGEEDAREHGHQLAHPRRTTGDELAGTYWVPKLLGDAAAARLLGGLAVEFSRVVLDQLPVHPFSLKTALAR